jgi:hypothetical protein
MILRANAGLWSFNDKFIIIRILQSIILTPSTPITVDSCSGILFAHLPGKEITMKINPLDRIHTSQQVDKRAPGQGDFKRILDQAVGPKSASRVDVPPMRPILGPLVVPAIDLNAQECQGAERILNALERYQHLLADTRANLRAVEPAIQMVRQEVERLVPLLAGLPEDDPLKTIMGEVLMTAAKEIARFENGEYVGP